MAAAKKQVLHPSFRGVRDCLIAMFPLGLMTVYLYGARPAIMLVIAVVTAVLCDLLVALLRGREYDISDITSVSFAIIFTLMLPASSRYELVFFGVLLTVLLGKQAFGGWGGYPFHPSAFGFAAVSICFPDQVFHYPKPFGAIGIGLDSGAVLYDAPAATLKLGGIPPIDKSDLLLGNYQGPMGATFCIILLASLLLLVAHGEFTWHVPASFLLTVSVWALLFPRVIVGRAESVMYELLAGSVVFVAVYIASEPVTSPVNPTAKLVYGILLGICTMLFSHYGVFQMGAIYAVLLINPLSSWLDRRLASREATVRGVK